MAGRSSGNAAVFSIRVEKNDFPRIAAGLPRSAERVVAKTAMDLSAQMKVRAAVDTGFMRASITAARVASAHWRVTVGAEYGIYVEMGTRHMAAQPFVRPSVNAIRPVFVAAMRRALA